MVQTLVIFSEIFLLLKEIALKFKRCKLYVIIIYVFLNYNYRIRTKKPFGHIPPDINKEFFAEGVNCKGFFYTGGLIVGVFLHEALMARGLCLEGLCSGFFFVLES